MSNFSANTVKFFCYYYCLSQTNMELHRPARCCMLQRAVIPFAAGGGSSAPFRLSPVVISTLTAVFACGSRFARTLFSLYPLQILCLCRILSKAPSCPQILTAAWLTVFPTPHDQSRELSLFVLMSVKSHPFALATFAAIRYVLLPWSKWDC